MKTLVTILCFALASNMFAGELEQEIAIEIAIAKAAAIQPAQQESVLQPIADPVISPPTRQKFKTVQETRYRTVQVKHCNGRRCYYTLEQRPYTVSVRVPVDHVAQERIMVADADQYATPLDAAQRMLNFMRTKERATLLDLGSGDGRMVVEWARWLGYPAIGIESDPERVAQSRAFAERQGVSHLVKFIEGDFTTMEWPQADVIYVYQFPDVMAEISGRLKSFDRVVSFAHEVPGLAMSSHGDFYSWQKPKPAPAARPVAYWNGRTYTGPVCNKANCAMCNTIRAQLGM